MVPSSSKCLAHPPFSRPLRTPPMATTMFVPMKTAHLPGQYSMQTTVPLALPASTAGLLLASHTPVAMRSSTPTAGPQPPTMAQNLRPLVPLPPQAPTRPASCPMRPMRSSTHIRFLGQRGTPPTGWDTPRHRLLVWSGPHMRHMTPLASMPRPLASPTPPNTQTTARGSSSACRLTCKPGPGISAGRGEGSRLSLIFRGVARCPSPSPTSSLPLQVGVGGRPLGKLPIWRMVLCVGPPALLLQEGPLPCTLDHLPLNGDRPREAVESRGVIL